MAAIWSGSLSFGLVTIPVKLHSITAERGLSFDLLHKKDLSPIRHARICRKEEREVPYHDLVKGYQYETGEYIVLTDEDFMAANASKTKALQVMQFVREDEIDPIYFAKSYYIEAEEEGLCAYGVLTEALKRRGMVGITSIVLKNREHLVAVRPYQNALLLQQLRFHDEIILPVGVHIPATADIREEELALTEELVGAYTRPFEPASFRDTYTSELKQLIQHKARGKTVRPRARPPQPTHVSDLIGVLRQSIKRLRPVRQ